MRMRAVLLACAGGACVADGKYSRWDADHNLHGGRRSGQSRAKVCSERGGGIRHGPPGDSETAVL